jgi:formylglycine-generating enzyme required for sulfatase activity
MDGRSWYAPSGLADAVGNVGEYVATFFGGLRSSNPGDSTAWSFEDDFAYNFLGKAYNTDSGDYTEGLPSLLFVGGSWRVGATTGVRYANANGSPGYASGNVGFRLAR